jgi:pimeloyl-ACP methyl ester carboxylesterase
MADDYASWIGARFDGPVDVLGFSTGGEVAQYLAADHGELVRRLVLSDTGCRLGEDAKALLRAARDKAAQGRAAEAQADIANHIDFGRFGQGVVKLLGKRLMKEPDDVSDYIATIEADLGHDATDALSRIAAPTLVIAGSRDFFYPDPIIRETAERIPQATLRLYDGVGHAVSKTHKRRFEDDVLGSSAVDPAEQPDRGRWPWSTFGPHPIGAERFTTVSSGRSFAQVAGAILGKQDRVQNPENDEVADLGRHRRAS